MYLIPQVLNLANQGSQAHPMIPVGHEISLYTLGCNRIIYNLQDPQQNISMRNVAMITNQL